MDAPAWNGKELIPNHPASRFARTGLVLQSNGVALVHFISSLQAPSSTRPVHWVVSTPTKRRR